ncbi:biliverdin-producing heme oxygenase [Mucilaginibacter myungsuensis]|uniref:Biliverdin-producing heme oxygenase n=1 Tax=Mucilaginibacter myungsuensis TaxID=649104 RepID=A0A929PX50_9SPHI|nr:biliverdin-producing heme oxygenase [Mucilaginibacter myungsuensis]MBE9662809.1 biliverdin-producing heme oxygenase [Mucilaginibacter myungsuensis]MDN3598229.1 biliverdin-producing heme oxygenase [Mucilaginibacter myungsuensis]
MLQELLKEATRPYHDQLEQAMFVNQIMDGTLTKQQYQKVLSVNYLAHAHFEGAIVSHLSPALQEELDIDSRIKIEHLQKDLEELDINVPFVPQGTPVESIEMGDASLLGAMYVLEGATLGGHVIVKRLLQNEQLKPLNLGYHYYQAYGADLVYKWKSFVQVLNTRVEEKDYPKAVKSAGIMFKNMKVLAEAITV